MSQNPTTVVPSEVGWQFVPQYYTFVNKQPDRLHCFYTKQSTFTHGTEGDDAKACFGQQEIHKKITSLEFTDCKVYIHSVDSQSSAHGGIIIQVIGEMSNAGAPWKKFVQTFFLAEQPGGYFVLNDMFRFLKEDGVESDELSEDDPTPAEAAASTASSHEATINDNIVSSDQTTVTNDIAPEPESEPEVSHIVDTETAASVVVGPPSPIPESASVQLPTPVTEVVRETTPAPSTAAAPAQQSEHASSLTSPPPAQQSAPATTTQLQPQAPTAAPALAQTAPSVPKTWANLAAANSQKWGAAVATESRGVTEAIPSPVQSHGNAHSHSGANGHALNGNGALNGAGNGAGSQSAVQAANSITHAQCFIKGVVEQVTSNALTNTLTARFGPLSSVDIVRTKACAFVEFSSVAAAKSAIIASLPVPQGGEGGVFIPSESNGSFRVVVETKKERGDRPPTRPRGGAPVNQSPRGGPPSGQGGRDSQREAPKTNAGAGNGRGGGQQGNARGRGAPSGGAVRGRGPTAGASRGGA